MRICAARRKSPRNDPLRLVRLHAAYGFSEDERRAGEEQRVENVVERFDHLVGSMSRAEQRQIDCDDRNCDGDA